MTGLPLLFAPPRRRLRRCRSLLRRYALAAYILGAALSAGLIAGVCLW
jgi:hypothetical protein